MHVCFCRRFCEMRFIVRSWNSSLTTEMSKSLPSYIASQSSNDTVDNSIQLAWFWLIWSYYLFLFLINFLLQFWCKISNHESKYKLWTFFNIVYIVHKSWKSYSEILRDASHNLTMIVEIYSTSLWLDILWAVTQKMAEHWWVGLRLDKWLAVTHEIRAIDWLVFTLQHQCEAGLGVDVAGDRVFHP